MMSLTGKLKIYREIAEDFGYSEEKDQLATYILSTLIETDHLRELTFLIKGRPCLVFGAGENLEKDFLRAREHGLIHRCILISADDAASLFMEKGTKCDVVVTDLDGEIRSILWTAGKGGYIVVHGHGDNIDKLRRYVPLISTRVIGTTQVREAPRVYNFGGFTDGDRAVFLAVSLGASRVGLLGMDFKGEIGRYSKKNSEKMANKEWIENKKKKLKWAEKLVELCAQIASNMGSKVYNLSNKDIAGVKKLNMDSFNE